MAEIRALPWNGYTVASTFSGGGGSSLGYRMAGFRVAYANEFVAAARDTYRANARPGTHLDGRDIREVTGGDVLAACGVERGGLDLLDGSPPCASFSSCGARERLWGTVRKYSDTAQRTDDLFFEYARLLGEIQPKAFIAENVAGLIRGTAKGYFQEIMRALKGCGYRVEARLLDAQWLGVPQTRRRLVVVGVREDLNRQPVHPKPLAYRYSIREALPWDRNVVARRIRAGEHVDGDTALTLTGYAYGAEWRRIGPTRIQSAKYLNLKRPALDRPCPAVVTFVTGVGGAAVLHPTECRKLSLNEVRRLCGFPDDFVLTGSYAQGGERLARAVPPVMMAHIAAAVRDEVLARTREAAA